MSRPRPIAPTHPGCAALLLLLLPCCAREREAPAPASAAPLEEPAVARPRPGDAAKAAPLVPQAMQALERRDLVRALALAEQALALDPACAPARLVRVRVLREEAPTMDLDRALVDVRTLRLDAPDEPALIANEGLLRFHLGQHEAARPLLERALSLPFLAGEESGHASAAEALGRIELAQRRVDAAARLFEKAHALAPKSAAPCLALAE